jgi:ABC-type cobalt transport system substrate-binding protein
MTFFPKLIKRIRNKFQNDKKGVALLIVLASMATLSVFIGEITYTAQINQKLAYDRLDQVKAQALAKSGLKIALLRIRAYSEIKKTIGKMADSAGASADAVNSVVPKSVIEKIWSEPITVPFSGDISSLPGTIQDALGKFRKDSSMEGKLYISIQAQSNKFNLNSTLPQFASMPGAPKTKGSPSPSPGAVAEASPTPVAYDPAQARQLLGDQIKQMFQKRFDDDEKFRDTYRSYRIDDLVNDILGWSDLSFDSPREQSTVIPFKKAPFYHISELNYLQSMDDEIYNMLSDQFSAGVASAINVNSIKEPVLRALVPQMTDDEVKKFFEFRDNTGENANTTTLAKEASGDDNSFKGASDFFKYLKEKVAFFSGSDSKVTDFQNALTQRGIEITTEENNFLVHIEATVQQTKRTLEAMVSMTDSGKAPAAAAIPGAPSPTPTPANPPQTTAGGATNSTSGTGEKSNLKITQLRFL